MKCAACHRPSKDGHDKVIECSRGGCRKPVCLIHAWWDAVINTQGHVVATVPICVACRWGNA